MALELTDQPHHRAFEMARCTSLHDHPDTSPSSPRPERNAAMSLLDLVAAFALAGGLVILLDRFEWRVAARHRAAHSQRPPDNHDSDAAHDSLLRTPRDHRSH